MQLTPMDRAIWDHVVTVYLECIPRLKDLPGGWARNAARASRFIHIAQEIATESWGIEMAKNGKQPDFQISNWVNIHLADEDKESIKQIGADWAAIFAYMGERVALGYRFSISWDTYSNAVQVSLVCRDPDNANYTLAMSARHPDLDTAMITLMYKDEVITKGEWAAFVETVRKDFSWD